MTENTRQARGNVAKGGFLSRLGLDRPELRAWAMYDWAVSSVQTTIMVAVFPVYFGNVANHHVAELQDINAREFLMLGLLAVAVLWMGVYPKPFTDVMQVSVGELLKHVAQSKLL